MQKRENCPPTRQDKSLGREFVRSLCEALLPRFVRPTKATMRFCRSASEPQSTPAAHNAPPSPVKAPKRKKSAALLHGRIIPPGRGSLSVRQRDSMPAMRQTAGSEKEYS